MASLFNFGGGSNTAAVPPPPPPKPVAPMPDRESVLQQEADRTRRAILSRPMSRQNTILTERSSNYDAPWSKDTAGS